MIVSKRGSLYKQDSDFYILLDVKKTKVTFSKVTLLDNLEDGYNIEIDGEPETKTIKKFIKEFELVKDLRIEDESI